MAQDSKVADALESFGAQDALVMDGFDDCIVGLLERFGIPEPIVVYDRAKVIQKLVDNGIEDHEGAEEPPGEEPPMKIDRLEECSSFGSSRKETNI